MKTLTTNPLSTSTASSALLRIRRPLAMLACAMFCLSIFGIGGAEAAAAKAVTAPVAPEILSVFPLMTWNIMGDPYQSGAVTPQLIEEIPEAAYNTIAFPDKSLMDAVVKSGAKAIVNGKLVSGLDWKTASPEAIRAAVDATVEEFKPWDDIIVGYRLRDEPDAECFPGLAIAIARFKELRPKAWAYVNLFPSYATPDQLKAESFQDYLDKYIAICQPTILSYDHYADLGSRGFTKGYWSDMATVYGAGRKHGLPVIPVILTMEQTSRQDPTPLYVRLQTFTHLAYGAKGIQHYTYFAPRIGSAAKAPIDPYGHRTEVWNTVRLLNEEVGELSKILKTLEWKSTYYIGDKGGHPEGVPEPTEESFIQSGADNARLLVGDFVDPKGNKFSLVVNLDVKNPINPQVQFRAPLSKATIHFPYPIPPYPMIDVWATLSPGFGVLLEIK